MFVKIRRCLTKERGDTLVEVLISIGIVSLVLGGAFVSTNRSLQSTRDAQERANAFKLVEGQIEYIKGLAITNPSVLFSPSATNPFCVKVNAAGVVSLVDPSDAACSVDSAGSPTGGQPIYRLSATQSPTTDTFTVRSEWDDIKGGESEVEMVYRVHP